MFANTLNPVSNATHSQATICPTPFQQAIHIGDVPSLHLRSLSHCQPAGEVRHLPGVGVCNSDDKVPIHVNQQVFERHLSLQELLLDLELMGEHTARQDSSRLASMLHDSISYVYVEAVQKPPLMR